MFELGERDDQFGVQDTIGEADKGVRSGGFQISGRIAEEGMSVGSLLDYKMSSNGIVLSLSEWWACKGRDEIMPGAADLAVAGARLANRAAAMGFDL